jgi:hypothetical protein
MDRPAKMEPIEVPKVRWLFILWVAMKPCIANKAFRESKDGGALGCSRAGEPLDKDEPSLFTDYCHYSTSTSVFKTIAAATLPSGSRSIKILTTQNLRISRDLRRSDWILDQSS